MIHDEYGHLWIVRPNDPGAVAVKELRKYGLRNPTVPLAVLTGKIVDKWDSLDVWTAALDRAVPLMRLTLEITIQALQEYRHARTT